MIGLLALVGWAFDIQVLRHLLPGFADMPASSAVCCTLSGLSLWWLRRENIGRARRCLGYICAAIVLLIAIVTLLESILYQGWDVGELLYPDIVALKLPVFSSRMAPQTALGFIIESLALITVDWELRPGRRLSQILSFMTALFPLQSLIAYAYGLRALLGQSGYPLIPQMSLPTATAFLFLSFGTLWARPGVSYMKVVTSGGDTAPLFRRLLPLLVVAPTVLGMFIVDGLRARLYGPGLGMSLFVASTAAVITILLWASASRIQEVEAARSAAGVALRASEGWLHQAIEATSLGTWGYNPLTGEIAWSDRCRAIAGVGPNVPADYTTLHAVVHEEDLGDVHRAVQEILVGGTNDGRFERELRIRRLNDGATRWVRVMGRVSFVGGRATSFVGTVLDVTDRKEAEQRLTATRELLGMAQRAGKVVSWGWDLESDTIRRFYVGAVHPADEASETISYAKWLEKLGPDDRKAVQTALGRTLQNGEEFRVEFRTLGRDGAYGWRTVRGQIAARDASGKAIRITGVSVDITESKRGQEELQRAKEAAEAASQAKSIFLANMSHEIRTPLNAILGFSEVMSESELSYEDRLKYVLTIMRNGKTLAALIDDILDLSKVEADRLTIEKLPVSVPNLISEVLSLLERTASDKGLGLRLQVEGRVPETITTDPTRLKQILLNVVGNALKFTEQGEVRIVVRLVTETTGRPKLVFAVKDTGRGIRAEQTRQLFQAFSQADPSTTRQYGGTGLGLLLSRRLARLLGGDVVLTESETGKGSTFTISLDPGPLEGTTFIATFGDREQPADVTTPMLPEPILKDVRVLVVEDAPDNQMLVRRYLARSGAVVEAAFDGVDGVERALTRTFDVVLMDIQMPRLDGYGTTMQLRRAGFARPIIALTAHAMKEERDRALNVGCDDYLTKPISRATLIQTIARQLAREAAAYNQPVHLTPVPSS